MAFHVSRAFLIRLGSLNRTSKSLSRLYSSTDVIRKDRYIDRVKKFVFGEGVPPEKLEETSDRFAFNYTPLVHHSHVARVRAGKSKLSFDLISCGHFVIFVWPEHSRLYLLHNIWGDATESSSKFRKTPLWMHAHATNKSSSTLQQKLIFCLHYSYYELTKTEEPSVYTMEMHEIVDKLESIVSETIPQSKNGGKWDQESVIDIVHKYEVIILLNLKWILGVCHFSCQFPRVSCSNTIIFYLFTWMFFLVRYLTDVTRNLVYLSRITS